MSLLRSLALTIAARDKLEPARALGDAALLLRRAGLETLLDPATITVEEVELLARAGERVAVERVLLFFREARKPGAVESILDGGKAARAAVVAQAFLEEREAEEGTHA